MLQIIMIIIVIAVMMMIVTLGKRRFAANRFSICLLCMLLVYIIGNLYFTLFYRTVGSGTLLDLRPFQSYYTLRESAKIYYSSTSGFIARFLSGTSAIDRLILNILLYYPLGYLLPILLPKLKPKHVILIGCLCSIATEATQYLLKMGWCETDDVIHNTLGTAIGVWVWLWQSKRLNVQRSANPGKDET